MADKMNIENRKIENDSLYAEHLGIQDKELHEKIISEKLNWINLSFKRGVDLLGAFAFMLTIGWWLFPIVAIMIKLDSPGPVFFKQKREGIYNSRFNCYKFRSMIVNKEADYKQATKNDPRVTRIGKFLRKFSIGKVQIYVFTKKSYILCRKIKINDLCLSRKELF